MEIADQRVATIHYTLTNDAGEVIDKSPTDAPLAYLHGAGNIVPGLEKQLAGKQAGDKFDAKVQPEEAYGPRHDGLVQSVPRSAFQGIDTLKPGMQFETKTERGPLLVTVTEVGDEQVTVDGNHPLAGQHLNFAVEVTEVREASAEEQQQGHVAR